MTASVKNVCRWGGLSVLLVLAVVSLAVGLRNGIVNHVDFQWMPAKIMLGGENPYVYSLNHLPWRTWMQIDANQIPSCLLLLAPWTLMDYPLANAVWAFCNIVFTGMFLFFVYKVFFADASVAVRNGFVWIMLLLLCGTPLRVTIGNGQHVMFSLAFFMSALFCELQGRHVLSGVLMALCFFKYTTVAPMLLVFVMLRAWKPIVVGAGLHIAATLGLSLYLHESPVTLVLQSLKVGSMLTGAGDADPLSLLAFCDVSNHADFALPCYAFYGLLAFVVVWIGKKDVVLKLAMLAVVANVMFYHRIYDFVTLVFPLVYVLLHWTETDRCGRAVRALTVVNVAWTFFGERVFAALGWGGCRVPVTFALEHLLLAALLVRAARNSPSAKVESVNESLRARLPRVVHGAECG